ncbi:MAG: PTS sugar transporter subunit IIA [Deltaproteobacteria bacterium]|nr:PTS sugar transporter subunit IIA [Deltaproteobacteria bacterium]
MRLADVMKEDYIFSDLKAREKQGVLAELVSDISPKLERLDGGSVLSALLEREKLGTTGIGHGVAIPHGKVKGLTDIKVFFGRSKKGVDFNSMDRMPVYIFFLIVAPENSAAAHLKILACISHLLKNQDLRTRLMKAEDPSEIYRIITEADRKSGLV